MHTRPDVLLLPSDLAAWLKATPASCSVLPPHSAAMAASEPKVLSINPGRAVKGSSNGTFALVSVGSDCSNVEVAAHARAEIRRL